MGKPSTNKPKEKREKNDLYPTPKWCFANLPIDWSLFYKNTIHEPAQGDARITDYLYNSGCYFTTGADIATGTDFRNTNTEYDLIITNPPYDIVEEFVAHALKLAPTVIMLLKNSFLGTKKRYDLLINNNPTRLYCLSDRPSFSMELDPPTKGSDGSEYSWFCWDKTGKIKQGFDFIRKDPKLNAWQNND